jgi:hypothetical protein
MSLKRRDGHHDHLQREKKLHETIYPLNEQSWLCACNCAISRVSIVKWLHGASPLLPKCLERVAQIREMRNAYKILVGLSQRKRPLARPRRKWNNNKIEDGCLLMLEAVSTSETLVNFYQTTRRNNPENSHLHTRRRENLKSRDDKLV